jgi:hypothetical protein
MPKATPKRNWKLTNSPPPSRQVQRAQRRRQEKRMRD